MTEHLAKMADDVFGAIRRYVARNLAPVADRVDALERRAPEKGERGEKGDKGDPGERGDRGEDGRDAAVDLEALALKAAALIPPPADGKDAEPVDIDAIALTAAELVPAPEIDVAAIAKQAAALVPAPRDGRDAPEVDLDLVAQKVAALVPAPKDGKDASAVDLDEVAKKAAALIPAPRDGIDADPALIPQEVERQLALLPRPVDPPPVDAIVAQVLEQVMKAFDALPAPKDGKDADAEAIAADVLARVMKELPTPKDGRDGVDGKDGRNGRDGESAPPVDLDALAVKVLDKVPGPEDGRDGMEGPPGRDALHLEIQPEIDPERSYRRGTFAKHAGGLWRAFESTAGMKGWECVVQGLQGVEARQDDTDPRKFVLGMTLSDGQELVKDFRFAFPLDRGVFDPDSRYVKGDGVTYMGGWFVAQRDDPGRPEVGDGWRLAVKRGRNGKDGKDGERGEVGKAGPPGRDLTQLGPSGEKW